MKRLALPLLLLSLVVGCDFDSGPRKPAKPKVDEVRLGKAKTKFNEFADEALKGAGMLETMGATPADDVARLDPLIRKMSEMLEKANDIYPSNETAAELYNDGLGTLRFFRKSLENLRAFVKRENLSEDNKKGLNGAVSANANAVRQMHDRMKGRL